jgi:2-iminobutanoate/2-iminopropanoate deaminase
MEHLILPSAQPLRLPFSQAVRAGDFLFLSGAIGAKPGTMTLVEGGLSAGASGDGEYRRGLARLRARIR